MRGARRLAAASGAMEGNMHLLQLIREMRSQIDELERENRALRGELRACGPGTTASRAGSLAGPTARPDPAPGPAAAAAEQGQAGRCTCWRPVATPSPCACRVEFTGTLQSPLAQCASCSCPCSLRAGRRCPRGPAVPAAGWVCSRLRSSLCSSATTMTVRRYSTAAAAPAPPGTRPPRAGKSPADCFSSSSPSKMKLFQEHVRRCRGKVKAVSFLLPMDVSACAENQGSLKSPQNQDTHELTTITEKDM
ncbi:putative coiled-coil domain-containing protein 195 [Anas acuta]|uniref:putative coiled-coil domain-containing protein 195 n=1 Tax=Anas acuta TaxID=28680 RepID=UPI0035C89A85